jgi:hypothetical protein
MDFAPLRLCAQTARALDALHALEPKEPKLAMYNECLRQVTVGRALKQVVYTVLYSLAIMQISQVFQTITWERLCTLIPFYTSAQLESFVIDAAKKNFVQVGTLYFAEINVLNTGTYGSSIT